jgi:EAL domain-containing protein (putative c-di-GMP-specific phosphodiesterase class I)
MTSIKQILSDRAVRSVFQTIIDLDSGEVVGYEALARGPVGPLESPTAMFSAARAEQLLPELDEACRDAAFIGAAAAGMSAPLTLFVNVEPEVLNGAPIGRLLAFANRAPSDLEVVLEITERALARHPAELLATVERVRDLGWGVALDDVGAEPASLTFMSLLQPDVIKLDLRIVQDRPSFAIAAIMNAVNAYAERTGALVLAEGIETPAHLKVAQGLGCTLGQGWLFGPAGPTEARDFAIGKLNLLEARRVWTAGALTSPFACLPPETNLRRSPKAMLVEVSKQLEREAIRIGESCVVASTFQDARHFTPATAERYCKLVQNVGFACALGENLPAEPLPGLRGASLLTADPLRDEWAVVVLSPHFSAALLGRDLGDTGPDMERMFEYTLTYRRPTVIQAACCLLARVVQHVPSPEGAEGADG